jgi:hypothetical protein
MTTITIAEMILIEIDQIERLRRRRKDSPAYLGGRLRERRLTRELAAAEARIKAAGMPVKACPIWAWYQERKGLALS